MTEQFTWQVLKMAGYDLQLHEFTALREPFTHLLMVRHVEDVFQETVLIPMDGYSEQDWTKVSNSLLEQCPYQLTALNRTLIAIGGCHEPGIRYDPLAAAVEEAPSELTKIRKLKEKAIMAQNFDLAADYRDQERKLQRNAS